ncbi:hypothetical protein AMECASPLE_021693 [Ameca splendens]|uniref:Uncharacterized protein n=1 Tax=Ameca splendens TaxID=208324 RepID=A0ABV0YFQ0_9TELE
MHTGVHRAMFGPGIHSQWGILICNGKEQREVGVGPGGKNNYCYCPKQTPYLCHHGGVKPPLSQKRSANGEEICNHIQFSRDMSSSDTQKVYSAPLQEGV